MILSLDSSAVIDIFRGREVGVRDRFIAARQSGVEFKLSTVALYELTAGAKKSARPQEKLEELARFAEGVEVAAFDAEDAMVAGVCAPKSRFRGRPLIIPTSSSEPRRSIEVGRW